MSTLALILARAGSKGVPSKNIRPIADRPCIEWTIDFARAARSIHRIALSTDSPEAARIAARHGIDVINRPASLASDIATIDEAARHALESLDDPAINTIAILYANIPIRPAGLLDEAIALLHSTGAHSVQSYAPVGKNHPFWTAIVDPATGTVRPWQGDVLNHNIFRRQDLPPAHIPDGAILVVTREALMLRIPDVAPGPHAFLGALRRGILTDPGAVIDIDSEIDLLVADAILRSRAAPIPTA